MTELLLRKALEPLVDQGATEERLNEFFELFLKTTLLIPRKEQEKNLSGNTVYPNPFTDLLGITSKDKVYVPAFLSEEDAKDWYHDSLDCHSISGEELCNRMPEEWWITLNPGSDFGKEFSPWEVSQLKLGEEGLKEVIIEELSNTGDPVQFRALTEEEREKLTTDLTPSLSEFEALEELYCGVQISEGGDTLLFGALAKDAPSDSFKSELHAVLQQALIGDSNFEFQVGNSLESDATLSIFRFSKPLFSKLSPKKTTNNSETNESGFFQRLLQFFR